MSRKSRTASSDQLALDFDATSAAVAQPLHTVRPVQPPVADHRERTVALDPTRSFIVQSPAGSGKTGLLIQRYLVVLAHARAPEEALAITFTRKAAAEMRARVLQGLEAARNGTPSESDHQALTIEL